MSKPISYLLQGKNIILVIDGKSHTVTKDTHMNYSKIVDALKAQDWDSIRELVEPQKAIVNFGKGYVSIENGIVYWKGQPFNNGLSTRMIEMYQEGFPIEPMVHLMENLMQNPSKRSVEQFYGFVERNSLPITEDGYILAFKKVRKDYKDIHSGTIDNSIGQVIEMERNLVDDNPNSTCSSGLHFCSESYLDHFGNSDDPVMIMKINPADVVSIPTDYDGAKGRCCKYEVIGQVAGNPKFAFKTVVDTTYAKPAKSVTPQEVWPFVSTDTNTTWPFPTTKPSTGCGNSCANCDCDDDEDYNDLYDVRRKYGKQVVCTSVTLAKARAMVSAAISGKKAVLEVVKSGTNTLV